MKATELMIGDWIVKPSGHIRTIDRAEFSNDDAWFEDIKPIPLTPEILEKNGFYDLNTQWYCKKFLSNDCFDINISLVYREIEVSKLYGVGTDCEEVEYRSAIVFDNDICVHTLQHALRLCGLNELADNLKV